MKKEKWLLAALIFYCGLACSQNQEVSNPKGFFYLVNDVPGGVNYTILPNMRKYLRQVEVDDFDWLVFHHGSIGVGYRWNEWLANIYLSPYFLDFSTSEVEKSQTYGSFTVERSLLRSRNFRVNLGGGVGFYDFRVRVNLENEQTTVPFDQVLQSSFRVTPLLTNRGGTFDIFLQVLQMEKRSSGALLGWRIGYRHGWTPRTWDAVKVNLSEAPSDRFSQFYLQTSILLYRNW